MAFYFHNNKDIYFDHQFQNTGKYLIPFISKEFTLDSNTKVLEIGSGEGGVMKAFLEIGCEVNGVEIMDEKVGLAKKFLAEYIAKGEAHIEYGDIFDEKFTKEFKGRFDLIVLKDVIEHIHHHKRLLELLKLFLTPNGVVLIAFPPWYMPFGGHQQGCKSKFLSKLPYFHLLPWFLVKFILKLFGENEEKIAALKDIRSTGLSIEHFENLLKLTNFKTLAREIYLINPIYELKFGLKPKLQFKIITAIPYLRDFLSTGVQYLIELRK